MLGTTFEIEEDETMVDRLYKVVQDGDEVMMASFNGYSDSGLYEIPDEVAHLFEHEGDVAPEGGFLISYEEAEQQGWSFSKEQAIAFFCFKLKAEADALYYLVSRAEKLV